MIPPAFWAGYLEHHDALLPSYEAELAAIRDEANRRTSTGRVHAGRSGVEVLLSELVRRGVFNPSALARQPSVAF